MPDAREIGDDFAVRGVKLQLGASVHDPSDSRGKLFFNILATFAEFEADLVSSLGREPLGRNDHPVHGRHRRGVCRKGRRGEQDKSGEDACAHGSEPRLSPLQAGDWLRVGSKCNHSAPRKRL